MKKMVLEKKVYQDFRWATVEDIVAAGGDIYRKLYQLGREW
ncbi:hypothetical protein [Acetobacterium wieringae]|nr:hypothetical protein [Acetobacterium wieringae]